MMRTKASQQNRFLRIITIPFRALSKARDFYVKGMTSYADKMNLAAVPGSYQVAGLPRSFSTNPTRSSNEDYINLVRASSARVTGYRVDVMMDQRMVGPVEAPRTMPPRSTSVAMGRIDEESPCCYFVEDHDQSLKKDLKYPRSKSHSVSRRSAF